MEESLKKSALDHHRFPKPGKIAIMATKGMVNQRDLALAYSPGVASIAFNLLRTAAGDGTTIGPMLPGPARTVHVLTPSATVRRIVNMTAISAVDVNASRE